MTFMPDSGFPLLSLMIMTLPIGAGLIWLTPDPRKARWIALLTAVVDLALTLAIVTGFDRSTGGFQFIEKHEWIPTLHIQYYIGVDGMSVLFLPLAVLLFTGVILASWTSVRTLPRLYYTLLLILESATLGIFCALDTILFFLFWELTLVPIFFLISLWGIGPQRRYAAVKYTLMMLTGGVPLLFGFLLLAALFFLFGLASMGVPGTSGFPAEFLLILSALDTHTGAGLAALAGVVLGAAYFLGIYRRAFLGQVHNSTVADAIDLRARELVVIGVMGVLILFAGFYPESVLELTRTASEDWVSTLSGN